MQCPMCGKAITANPQDYTTKNITVQVKTYSCIKCSFTWLPYCEEKKINDIEDLPKRGRYEQNRT